MLWYRAGAAPIGRLATPMPLRWPAKPAAALLDYSLDATELLASETDTIAPVINAASGVDVAGFGVQGGVVILWLYGGVAGDDATIDLTLTTGSTRRVHRIVRIGIT
jgi:hypothetical protein